MNGLASKYYKKSVAYTFLHPTNDFGIKGENLWRPWPILIDYAWHKLSLLSPLMLASQSGFLQKHFISSGEKRKQEKTTDSVKLKAGKCILIFIQYMTWSQSSFSWLIHNFPVFWIKLFQFIVNGFFHMLKTLKLSIKNQTTRKNIVW